MWNSLMHNEINRKYSLGCSKHAPSLQVYFSCHKDDRGILVITKYIKSNYFGNDLFKIGSLGGHMHASAKCPYFNMKLNQH